MEKLVEWNNHLNGAPAGVIIFLVCIAIGYALKVSKWFPNNRIPSVVMLLGACLFMLMAPERRGQELKPYEEAMVARVLRDTLPNVPLVGISITATNLNWDDAKGSYMIAFKTFRDDLQSKNIAVIISPKGMPTRIWLTRNFCLGLFIGFIAWMAHKLVLKRIEKKLGLFDSSFDTSFVKPPEPPKQG